jgi:hypothetical protein
MAKPQKITEAKLNGRTVVLGQELHAAGQRLRGRLTVIGLALNPDGTLRHLDVLNSAGQARTVSPDQVTRLHRKINPVFAHSPY